MLSDPPAPTRSLVSHSVPIASDRPLAIPVGWTAAAGRLIAALFLLVTLEALYTVPKETWDLAVGSHAAVGILLGLGFAAVALGVLWVLRFRLAAWAGAAGERLVAVPALRWLLLTIGIGIALRVAWVLVFPAPFTSDGLAYYDLAARLAHGLSYQTPFHEWAEWPPGYPFFLFVFFRLLGVGPWAVNAANLLLFVGSMLAVYPLARRFGEATARLATLLLALWPNLIASAGAATKEMVLIFLLPLLLLLYLKAGEETTSPGQAAAMRLVAGMVLGYSTLTQPGVLLLAVAFAVYELLLRTPLLRAAGRLILLGAGMLLVILPWTYRNYRVLHTPVLVTSCGGDVLYRANNPLATGGWIANGERPLKQYDELTRSRLGYQWAKEWIRANPGKFLLLSLQKQVLFLGDDAVGFYETLKRGLGIGGKAYALAKLGSNVYWLAIWALILTALLLRWPTDWHRRPEVLLFLLTVLYFWSIDSVFESGARHHTPLAGLLAILAASLAQALSNPELPVRESQSPRPIHQIPR
jgi:4-amino-4-deoxy-L-arabinose transferase-like glycosyltransferase